MDSDQDEISSAHIVMNTIDGAFITNPNGRETPILDRYDEVDIDIQDDDGTHLRRIMLIDERLPDEDEKAGHLTTYTLFGREYWLKTVKISGHYWFRTHKDMLGILRDRYNESRGADQPELVLDASGVPDYPVSTWRWRDGTNVFDGLVRVIESLGNPVSASGAGSYYTMRFSEDPSDRTKLHCTVFEMGSKSSKRLFNRAAVDPNMPPGHVLRGSYRDTQFMARTQQAESANVVVAKGMQDMGRLPPEPADYSAAIELYNTYPLWDSAVTYRRGVRVRSDRFQSNPARWTGTPPNSRNSEYDPEGKVYECLADGTTGGLLSDGTKWKALYTHNLINPADSDNNDETTVYSPYTRTLTDQLSACGNPHNIPAENVGSDRPDSRTLQAWQTFMDLFFAKSEVRPEPTHLAVPDSNLVVKDGRDYRNWAVCIVGDPREIPSDFLYPHHPTRTSATQRNADFNRRIPEDFRVLVVRKSPARRLSDNTITARDRTFYTSAGVAKTDPFGKSYDNAIAQWRGGQWIVIHNPAEWHECAVLETGLNWQFSERLLTTNPTRRRHGARQTSWEWRQMFNGLTTDPIAGNDCFHYPTAVRSVDGLVYRYRRNESSPTRYYTDGMATQYEYTFGGLSDYSALRFLVGRIASSAFDSIFNLFNANMYSMGWWGVLFCAPYPMRKVGSGNEVGARYGGNEWWNDKVHPQGVLDLNNLTYTASGKRGWEAEDGDTLGTLSGISFYFNFDLVFRGALGDLRLWAGNLPFRVTVYDTEDNVWIADFSMRFLNETQQIMIPFTNFRIYRARNPFALNVDDTYTNIITPELNILEVFERRRVKMITLQWQEAYDKDGRFDPMGVQKFLLRFASGMVGTAAVATGTIDVTSFAKAPYAIAQTGIGDRGVATQPKRNIMGNITDRSGISNVRQLQRVAQAQLDLAQFRRDNMTVRVTGRCDIRPGDYVWVLNADLIAENDMPYTVLQMPPAEPYLAPAWATAVPPDPANPGVAVVNGRHYWKNTKRMAVRRVNHTVSAMGGPAGFVTHITLRDRIGWDDIGLL